MTESTDTSRPWHENAFAVFLAMPALFAWEALCILKIWEWHIVPLEMPPLQFAPLVACLLMISIYRTHGRKVKSAIDNKYLFTFGVSLRYTFLLGFGYALHLVVN